MWMVSLERYRVEVVEVGAWGRETRSLVCIYLCPWSELPLRRKMQGSSHVKYHSKHVHRPRTKNNARIKLYHPRDGRHASPPSPPISLNALCFRLRSLFSHLFSLDCLRARHSVGVCYCLSTGMSLPPLTLEIPLERGKEDYSQLKQSTSN